MSTSPSELKKMFPEFANETNPRINFFIGMAERRVNKTVFGDKADDAVCLMTAHLLTLGSRGGQGGTVTSEKVGDLSRSYSSASKGDDSNSLDSTSYGQMFNDLMQSCRQGPRVLGCQNRY